MGHSQSSHIIMNYAALLLTAALGAVSGSAASRAVTCDECQAASADLVARLLGEESLAEQIAILKLVVCPQLPAEVDCEGTLDMWFADMASCIYNHFILEQDVCGLLGLCYKNDLRTVVGDWTCDECLDILSRTSEYMARPETIYAGVAYRQGLISTVLPMAMPVLAGALNDQATELCQEVI